MDFWADWCRFCSDAVTPLRALETELDDDGLAIVGVSVDKDRAAFDRFLAKHDLTWPQHHGSDGMTGGVAQTYGVRALPLHVVIDPEGRIAASGVQLSQLRPTIEALLEGRELDTIR
jgi:peroxiredoxin